MQREIRKNSKKVYRHPSVSQCLFIGLVSVLTLVIAYAVSTPGKRAGAGYVVFHNGETRNVEVSAEQVILQWMKEHSDMSEQVLSKIYSVAMNSVNADLILAICLVESNFNPQVESSKGAIGLMGIMPEVWLDELKTHGIVREQDDLYTISKNINSGIYVLQRYLSKTNNLGEALRRYAGGDPEYAAKVLRRLGEISRARRSEVQPYPLQVKATG